MTEQQLAAMKLAQALRELADRFSEGWHDGIKIDASDIMLLAMAASAIEQAETAQGQEPVACPECNGNGEVETGIGMLVCDACHGSGIKECLTTTQPATRPATREEKISRPGVYEVNSYEQATQEVKDAFKALCKGRVEAAVLAEREACAQIVDANAKQCGVAVRLILESNATAIRARGNT